MNALFEFLVLVPTWVFWALAFVITFGVGWGVGRRGRAAARSAKPGNPAYAAASSSLFANQGDGHDFDSMLGPIRDSMEQYRLHQSQLFGSVSEEIKALRDLQSQLSRDTSDLASALKGSSTAQGQWGELQLRTVFELAGMLPQVDFLEQESLQGPAGNSLRPDAIICLPEGRTLVVDAKAPLSAYLASRETDHGDSGEGRGGAAKRLAQSLRRHIAGLSSKQYWAALNSSPDFVLMFVPNDGILALAAEVDVDLFAHAARAKVLIVTPTTLMALAKTIAYAWKQQGMSANTRQIAENAEALYHQLSLVARDFAGMGKALSGTVEAYNSLLSTMETRVVPMAKFLSPDAPVTKAAAAGVRASAAGQAKQSPMPLGSVVENRRAAHPDQVH